MLPLCFIIFFYLLGRENSIIVEFAEIHSIFEPFYFLFLIFLLLFLFLFLISNVLFLPTCIFFYKKINKIMEVYSLLCLEKKKKKKYIYIYIIKN